jgi:hypothetical protein
MTRFYPVPLYFAGVPSGASRNNASYPLSTAKTINEILMIFPASTNLNFTYRFFMIASPPANNTVFPGGNELTSNEASAGSFAGESIAYTMPFQYTIVPTNPILCLYATNNATGSLTASAVATITA